jgi:creatinine amidohydrolase/Fe(II)-dependent formamide hydrolase-like protein
VKLTRLTAAALLGLGLAVLFNQSSRPLTQALGQSLMLGDMTWVQVRSAIRDGFTAVIVPSGGIEQNGEHMVLAKHDRIVAMTAKEIAARLGKTLVAPVISFVPEGEFDPPTDNLAFPGTIGLRPAVFEQVLEDVARSLKGAGFRTILFIADHGGSLGPQQAVASRLDAQWRASGVRVLAINDYYADPAQQAWIRGQGETPATIGDHAGLLDTSELMAADPSGVDLGRLTPPAPSREPTGGSGDPRRATPERGKALLELKIQAAVAQIRRELTP